MPERDTNKVDTSSSQQACSSSGLRIGGMCLNWKVLGGLAAVGVGIWIVAPNLIAAAAPLLLFAACPLSMWLMMRGMSGGQQNAQTPAKPAADSTRTRDLPTLKGEHARLTAELEALESDVTRAKNEQAGSPNGSKNLSETRASHSEKASEDDVAP